MILKFSFIIIVLIKLNIQKIIISLVEIAKTDLDNVVNISISMIDKKEFDGSIWSTLALSILGNLDWTEKAGEILKALVDYDRDNGAYLNNFGIFLEKRGQIGEAIEYYSRAYATDYKHNDHEKASTFPAWTNLHRIVSTIRAEPNEAK